MKSFAKDWYHQVPIHVKEILNALQQEGHIAYIVGGAVRDLWLHLTPKDFDLVSSAHPDQIASLFPKTLSLGKQFGIMTVVTDAGSVEIARFRTDGAYTDHRRPDKITFSNPEEDALRRDFTINALFYDLKAGLVLDYVNGVEDLENKLLRTVGAAKKRFEEDALRMLRAVRFQGQLGFHFAKEIPMAITNNKHLIHKVSKERISQEFFKWLHSPHIINAWSTFTATGLWQEIFSVTPPEHSYRQMQAILTYPIEECILPLLALFQQWGTPLAPPLILPKGYKEKLSVIQTLSKEVPLFPRATLAEKKLFFQSPLWEMALAKSAAEIKQEQVQAIKKEFLILKDKVNPSPLLSGKELIALGIPAGPAIKKIQDQIRVQQLNEDISTKEEAIALAHALIKLA